MLTAYLAALMIMTWPVIVRKAHGTNSSAMACLLSTFGSVTPGSRSPARRRWRWRRRPRSRRPLLQLAQDRPDDVLHVAAVQHGVANFLAHTDRVLFDAPGGRGDLLFHSMDFLGHGFFAALVTHHTQKDFDAEHAGRGDKNQ